MTRQPIITLVSRMWLDFEIFFTKLTSEVGTNNFNVISLRDFLVGDYSGILG